MFNNLRETVKALNADVNNVANSERAKKLRSRLLKIGIPMAVCGFLGVFVCFAMFAVGGFNAVDNFDGSFGFPTEVLVPFLLFIPCAIVGGIGMTITSIGFKIVITGYTTNLIKEAVGNNCPNCGEAINPGMSFCAKCGTKARKECSQCQYVNPYKNEFCEKCGNKLN